jgi:hypothetical protein
VAKSNSYGLCGSAVGLRFYDPAAKKGARNVLDLHFSLGRAYSWLTENKSGVEQSFAARLVNGCAMATAGKPYATECFTIGSIL